VAHEDGSGYHIYHQYTLLHKERDAIMRALQAKDIACAVYYPIPLHRQDVFIGGYRDCHCPVSDSVADRCFSLPVFPEMTDAQVDEVISVIRGALGD